MKPRRSLTRLAGYANVTGNKEVPWREEQVMQEEYDVASEVIDGDLLQLVGELRAERLASVPRLQR
ncbi:MAG: hypothetical protein HY278_06035 [candidate division NC10 bacterium]|nr:hypothetical protein [candidate division NC10 bacterium]